MDRAGLITLEQARAAGLSFDGEWRNDLGAVSTAHPAKL